MQEIVGVVDPFPLLATPMSAHSCQSPTHKVNGCHLPLLTRTQTSEQEYNDLTASNRWPSTPYPSNTPQSFTPETRS